MDDWFGVACVFGGLLILLVTGALSAFGPQKKL